MSFKFPYTNFQELNLDWIIKKVKELSKIVESDDSIVSQYIERLLAVEEKADAAEQTANAAEHRADGANATANNALSVATEAKQTADTADLNTTLLDLRSGDLSNLITPHKNNLVQAINDAYNHGGGGGGGGSVDSVNGQTGVVVLYAEDVGALPDTYTAPVSSVNGHTGAVALTASDVGALPDTYTAPVSSVNGNTGAVTLTASDVGALPDTYTAPVSSVNGNTGAVTLTASDVGALPDTYTAPVTSVNGQTGAVTITAPVSSVNGKTGAVTLTASDVGALPDTYTAPVSSVNGQTGAVTVPGTNLLDNWYFVGGGSQSAYGAFPINQRGQTTYSANDAYGIDRWKMRFDSGGSCTVGSGGVTISGGSGTKSLVQTYPNGGRDLCGKTVTFSALLSSVTGTVGVIIGNSTSALYNGTVIGETNVTEAGIASVTVNIPATLSNNYLNFVIGCGSGSAFTVIAAKLEIGDTQTLARYDGTNWVLNEIPSYSEEIVKCQAYLARIDQSINARASFLTADRIDFLIPISQNMTANPATIIGSLDVCNLSGAAQSGFSLGAYNISGGCCRIRAGKTAHGLSDAFLSFTSGAYISCEP